MQYQLTNLLPAVYVTADAGSLGGLLKIGAIATAAGMVFALLMVGTAIKMAASSGSKNTKLRDHGRSSGLLLIAIFWAALGFLVLGGLAIFNIFGGAISTFIGL